MTGFFSPSSHLDPIFPMGQMQEPVTGSHVTPPLHWHRWLHPWPKVPWAHTTWGKEENEGIKTIFSNSLSFQLSSYKQHVLVSCSQQLTALLIAYGAQQQQIDMCSTYMNYATITNISKWLRLIPLVGRYAWYFASSPSFSDELKGGRGKRGVCWGSSRAKLLANLLLVGVA